ncbi:MAG: hypothetical protein EOO23_07325, partial [Comamonadaceae bacterium]
MIQRRSLLALPLLAPFLTATAGAQGLSSRPVTIVSPYMAGGTSDIIAEDPGDDVAGAACHIGRHDGDGPARQALSSRGRGQEW